MREIKNTVYWLTFRCYEPLENDAWNNYHYTIDISLDFTLGGVCREVLNNRGKYVIVTDVVSPYEIEKINKAFITNNIINISSGYDKCRVEKQIRWIFNDYGKGENMKDNNIFFCSDLHFNHKNIIRYCNRPWNSGFDTDNNMIITDEDVSKMNEDMISNWNSTVGENDTVYFLGDFCFGKNKKEDIKHFRERLNGHINIVLGNHDLKDVSVYYNAGFENVYNKPILWDDFFILSHEPVQWIKSGDVYANLYGHVHNQEMYRHVTSNTYNCCVEVNDYKPVSFSQILSEMKSKLSEKS